MKSWRVGKLSDLDGYLEKGVNVISSRRIMILTVHNQARSLKKQKLVIVFCVCYSALCEPQVLVSWR